MITSDDFVEALKAYFKYSNGVNCSYVLDVIEKIDKLRKEEEEQNDEQRN